MTSSRRLPDAIYNRWSGIDMACMTCLSIAADRLLYLDVSAGHFFQILDNALGLSINWDLGETYAHDHIVMT